jgi:hypothetical protein
MAHQVRRRGREVRFHMWVQPVTHFCNGGKGFGLTPDQGNITAKGRTSKE